MAFVTYFEPGPREVDDTSDTTRTYRHHYTLVSNVKNQTGVEAKVAFVGFTGINRFHSYWYDPAALAMQLNIVQDSDNPFLWNAAVTWQTFVRSIGYGAGGGAPGGRSSDPEQRQENPLARPPLIYFSHTDEEESLTKDLDNKKFLNSANDPYDPPKKRQVALPVIVIERNEAPWPEDRIDTYVKTTNSGVFRGRQPFFCLMHSIQAEPQWENRVYFYRARYEIHVSVAEEGWKPRYINEGYRYLNAAGTTWTDFYTGTAVGPPKLLAADGQELAAGAEPTYKTYRLYRVTDWGPAGLALPGAS